MGALIVTVMSVTIFLVLFVAPGVREARRYKALASTPKLTVEPPDGSLRPRSQYADIPGSVPTHFPELSAWDQAMSGSGTSAQGDAQYADPDEPVRQPPKYPASSSRPTHREVEAMDRLQRELETAKEDLRSYYEKIQNLKNEDTYPARILRQDAYARTSPYRKSEYVRILGEGMREQVIGYVHGEFYSNGGSQRQGSDVWFVLEDESVSKAQNFTDSTTSGLPEYNVEGPDHFEQLDWSGNVVARTTRYYKPYAA